jgi:beta-barrel assembly-enhancing protease
VEPSSTIRQADRRQAHVSVQSHAPLPRRHVRAAHSEWSRLLLASLIAAASCTVSQDQEVAIGAANAAKVDSTMPILRDTMVDRYITALGHSMASRTTRADLEWHFAVVNSSEVNAFALPGGYIFVDRGAIEQADRFDQLAGIMGHEIGHVVRRHGVEQLQKRERGELDLILLCTLTRVCRTIRGQVLVGASADALAAHYSQLDEAQADSEGVLNTTRAGIDPEGLPSFFQKLYDMRKVQPTAVDAFFSTHPTDQARIEATRQEIAALPPAPAGPLLRDTPEFHAMQTYVRALPAPPPPSRSAPTQ